MKEVLSNVSLIQHISQSDLVRSRLFIGTGNCGDPMSCLNVSPLQIKVSRVPFAVYLHSPIFLGLAPYRQDILTGPKQQGVSPAVTQPVEFPCTYASGGVDGYSNSNRGRGRQNLLVSSRIGDITVTESADSCGENELRSLPLCFR